MGGKNNRESRRPYIISARTICISLATSTLTGLGKFLDLKREGLDGSITFMNPGTGTERSPIKRKGNLYSDRNYVLPLESNFQKGRPLWRLYEARITLTQGNMVRGKEELFVTRKWVTQVWKVCESLRNPENCTVPSKTVQHWQTATLSQASLNLRTMSNHGRHGHGTSCFTSLAAVVRRDIKFSSPLTTHRSGAKL